MSNNLTDQFVPWLYQMNPNTEDLIGGAGLKNGMVVLIAEPVLRETLNDKGEYSEMKLDNLRTRNRWCTVEDVKVTDRGHVIFTAIYEDGTKKQRTYSVDWKWYVKKNTQSVIDGVPANFEPKYFRMNPETDDMLANGRELAGGMVVLIEDAGLRRAINDNLSDAGRYDAEKWNRWCKVYDIHFLDNGDELTFTGLYADGTKRQHQVGVNKAWFVKKASKPFRPTNFVMYSPPPSRTSRVGFRQFLRTSPNCEHPRALYTATNCTTPGCRNYVYGQ